MTIKLAAMSVFLLASNGAIDVRAQSQGTATSTIEGVVVSIGSEAPLDRAEVTLTRVVPDSPKATAADFLTPGNQPAAITSLMTQSDGKFSFKDVEPGQYRIHVARGGFASQAYGQPTVFGIGSVVNLTAGQAMKNVTFRMIRDGEVSGSVRDSHGNPIAGMQVSLMHQVYSRTGQLGRATEGTAVTDDRGEYRVFWVPPGSYLVSVGAAPSASLASPNISVVPDFPTTFYPGTIEAQHASVIEVAPGVDLPDVDIVMTQPAAYSIRGKVIDIGGGLPPAGFAVSLSQRIDAGSSLAWTLSAPKYSITTNPATGDFEIRGVIPGSYWLRASTLVCGDCLLDLPDDPADLLRYLTELANLRLESPPPGSLPSAEMSLDVNGSDIENIGLTLIPNVSIPIKFSLDGRDISSLIGVDQMRVALFPTASGAGIIDGNLTRARGFTSVYGVAPGEYRLGLRWTLSEQPDLFVKEARFGGKDILDQPFAVTNSSRETLNIVLSDKGSQLEGTLVDSLSNPRSDIPVVLIPDQNRDRPELYKDATTDKKGHFSFRGIAPGAYKVFAWEALESFSYWNKDVLSRYESQGKAVNITEGSRQTVDVKIISATK